MSDNRDYRRHIDDERRIQRRKMRKKRQRDNFIKRVIFLSFLVVLMVFAIKLIGKNLPSSSNNETAKKNSVNNNTNNQQNPNQKNPSKEPFTQIKMVATGDIMFHKPQITAAYDKNSGKYNFSSYFAKVKKYLDKADIVVGNFEGTVNEKEKLVGYPLFNAPMEAMATLKEAGFDVLSTANNHCCDLKAQGIISTIDAIEKNGMKHFGTNKEKNAPALIQDVKGIKIGFLSYSYGFNGMEGTLKEEERAYMISPIKEGKIKEDIEKIKKDGAELVVIYPHWGEEYMRTPTQTQKDLAHKFIDWGADLVLGSHPHVLQGTEFVEKDGTKKFIAYSMGNIISNQRRETLDNNRHTEAGVLFDIDIKRDNNTGKITVENVDFITTWVNREEKNGKRIYEVLPTRDFKEGGELRNTVNKTVLDKILISGEESMKVLKPGGVNSKTDN